VPQGCKKLLVWAVGPDPGLGAKFRLEIELVLRERSNVRAHIEQRLTSASASESGLQDFSPTEPTSCTQVR